MPPPAPAVRVDRPASYQIVLGESISRGSASESEPSGYSSLKYNHKPSSFVLNPSSPTLVPSSSDAGANAYALTFTPPTTSTQITYTGAALPAAKPGYFLLFHPTRKLFTLERLDASLVFNAGVYSKLHPAIPITDASRPGGAGSASDSGGEDEEAGEVYDYRAFLGRTTAAEEKRQKRLGALKRAGKEVVDLPEGEDDDDPDVLVIPDPVVHHHHHEDGSDVDAPGESDDDDFAAPAFVPPPPPPPQQQKKKPAPKPKKKKPVAAMQPEEIVIPDPEPAPQPLDSDDEEVEFSDEDEDMPSAPAAPTAAVAATPEAPADDDEFDFDIGKELEEALGSGDDGNKPPPHNLVFEDEESDEDEAAMPVPVAAGNGAPKSLREMFGGMEEEEEEEDSESEEE
ncbi:hypothetical protein BZA05DRAFT_403304 [Tricharina praecox]|uniref:uncharacterized protein n=1 Tax=Tricharina praecox TaxID=43433 RepID=UPI0022202FAD|nr:uncharacterized protein BZA05DRAFT_403304 [Tricharina praecox]KAI5848967.1 hypothetical protein BZA05DRAFT_403304 [Tricharina praecox]